jgi:UDP-4-amino-4-deoxy-L-arabinose-oxoglutarate aminotransferase
MKINFLRPNIHKADIQRMVKSIETGWLVHGKETHEFEVTLDKFLGRSSFVTSSCTASLHMSLILAGVGEGDEVITTPMSWVSTANVILYQGAKVVFADVDPLTGILDIEDVKQKITPKTKAIIVVHLYGQMADMREFSKLGIPIIEDSAHALEAERDGVKPGHLGFTACFSFHAAKNITCGQGGAIVTRNIDKCKLLVRDGVKNIDGKRVMLDFGYKYDLTDFQAALLIGQLKRIKTTHAKRLEVFKRYEDAFKGKIDFPQRTGIHAAHMFVIWVDNRDLIRIRLAEKGIDTSIHYPCIHLEPYYQSLGYKRGTLPVAEAMSDRIITLPTYALTRKEQDYVIKEVLNANSVNSA